MPYTSEYNWAPLSLPYPVADSSFNCTETEYNIAYVIPELSNGYLILTRIVDSLFFVLTTYLRFEEGRRINLPDPLEKAFVHFTITHKEMNHCLAMHRRNHPFAGHTHFGLRHEIDLQAITPLLEYILLPLPASISKSKSIKQLYKAIDFFIKNPTESGIYFKNGHYALKDGYNTEGVYPFGPYKLKKKRFSFFQR